MSWDMSSETGYPENSTALAVNSLNCKNQVLTDKAQLLSAT